MRFFQPQITPCFPPPRHSIEMSCYRSNDKKAPLPLSLRVYSSQLPWLQDSLKRQTQHWPVRRLNQTERHLQLELDFTSAMINDLSHPADDFQNTNRHYVVARQGKALEGLAIVQTGLRTTEQQEPSAELAALVVNPIHQHDAKAPAKKRLHRIGSALTYAAIRFLKHAAPKQPIKLAFWDGSAEAFFARQMGRYTTPATDTADTFYDAILSPASRDRYLRDRKPEFLRKRPTISSQQAFPARKPLGKRRHVH